MCAYVFEFQNITQKDRAIVGGKGANLGELAKMNDIHVPKGFCISTKAFRSMVQETSSIHELLEQLSFLTVKDRLQINALSFKIRNNIEKVPLSNALQNDITSLLYKLGEKEAYAVRSSATAEDLLDASFAGQQDTYLNVIGTVSILEHIKKCWASLFTERAILYRLQHNLDHRQIDLAVIIQKMVFPQSAGVLFTADPVTSHRKVTSIDASFGLGEAVVSGIVNTDLYKIRDGQLLEKHIATKKSAITPLENGGTTKSMVDLEQQNQSTLTDEQILQLEQLGRKIEKHFSHPQDIEWCLANGTYYILQSRPITTLYPIPKENDMTNHVYISVGHQQMMTDPIKPLGLSFYLLTTYAPMKTAGGRLFVDVASNFATTAGRNLLLNTIGQSDPLIKDALMTLLTRQSLSTDDEIISIKVPSFNYSIQFEGQPTIIVDLIRRHEQNVEKLKQDIQKKSGLALFDFILEDFQTLKQMIFNSETLNIIKASMNASNWINYYMEQWLGEKNVADTLSQSVPHNITSEMGLELLDVADIIRSYPEITRYLHTVKDDHFLDKLTQFKGGTQVQNAIQTYLHKYGMRCVGEIDVTRDRWIEKPATLIPLILNHVHHMKSNASRHKFEHGKQIAWDKEQDILNKLKTLPDGKKKADDTKRMIRILRNLSGYREYPKYVIVNHYFIYKQALLKEIERLVQTNIIYNKEDIYYLSFEELREVVRTSKLDYNLIRNQKDAYQYYEKLSPPRVMTSDGEIIRGTYKRENIPSHAIAGLPVSAGVVEGRARVLFHITEADLEEGDLLITPFTDPSWTPLFVSIKGLITEVGGLMTHGAVIAREYGLPTVVGVENATKLIKDGQWIRINGTEGYIEILS